MNKLQLISIFVISYIPLIHSQQPYIRGATRTCDSRDNSTSVLGYTCNGLNPTCQAYLTFRAQPPFTSISNISTLLSLDPSQLSRVNSVPENEALDTNRMVLVPVTCSCSGQNYQVNTSYTVQPRDTYLDIAENTFQGLSTCQALQAQNSIRASSLVVGAGLTIPLRCACPTQRQSDGGLNYLLSYLVTENQNVLSISSIFGVDRETILVANGLSDTDFIIFPNTTLLVPLEDPPTSSQVTAPLPPPPPPVVPVPPPPSGGGGSSRTWIYAVVGALGGVLLVGAIAFCVFFRKQKKKDEPVGLIEKPAEKEAGTGDSEEFLESISNIAQYLKVYTFEQIKAATEDFSPSCLIKGSVYRGTINGDFAAIKKMNGDVSNEINLLNKINHFNLIRLSGVSFNEGSWYLVYEYTSNGSLSDWIHRKKDQKILNWNERQHILLDVATGLNYLHCHTSPPHIHKDLNSTNILLDGGFRAKIANFGLARSAEGQDGHFALTRHIVGTKGYMAPEYLENGIVSPKLDVYAFGVLMLEILTGKQISVLYEEVNEQLSEVLTPVLSENGEENIEKLMDPMLQGNYPWDLVIVLFRLVDDCLKKDPSDRPNMDDIFQSLSRISASTLSGEWSISISESHSMPR